MAITTVNDCIGRLQAITTNLRLKEMDMSHGMISNERVIATLGTGAERSLGHRSAVRVDTAKANQAMKVAMEERHARRQEQIHEQPQTSA